MKRLIITQEEFMEAIPPFPHATFTSEAIEKWIKNKLNASNIDITKKFIRYEELETNTIVFEQDE